MPIVRGFISEHFKTNFIFLKLNGYGYHWDGKTGSQKLVMKSAWSVYARALLILTITAPYVFEAIFAPPSQGNISVADYSQKVMVGSILGLIVEEYTERGMKATSAVNFLNQLVSIEKRYVQGFEAIIPSKIIRKGKTMEYVAHFFEKVVIQVMPFVVGLGAALLPRNPLNLIYAFINTEAGIGKWLLALFPGWVLSLLLGIVNTIVWAMLLRTGVNVLLNLIVSVFTFPYLLHIYQRRLQLVSLERRKGVVPILLFKLLLLFRETQLLLHEFNTLYGRSLVLLQMVASVCLIASLYSCIQFIKGAVDMPFILMVFFPTASIDSILILLTMFGLAGDVYQESTEVRKQLKGNWSLMKLRVFKRFFESCPRHKVMFGATCFIEETTSLLYIHFCFCRVLDLLLIN